MAAGGIARLQAKSGGWEKRARLQAEPRGEFRGVLGRGVRGKWSEAAGHASLGFISLFTIVIFLTINKDVYFCNCFSFLDDEMIEYQIVVCILLYLTG